MTAACVLFLFSHYSLVCVAEKHCFVGKPCEVAFVLVHIAWFFNFSLLSCKAWPAEFNNKISGEYIFG